jgi:hypothetical protein
MILPWGHFVCEMSGMTPIGPRFPVKATLSFRGYHGIRTQIACHADSIGTDCSSLGLEMRRAEMMKGSVALWNRIESRQMTMLRYDVARAVIGKYTQEETTLSRRVGFSVLMR